MMDRRQQWRDISNDNHYPGGTHNVGYNKHINCRSGDVPKYKPVVPPKPNILITKKNPSGCEKYSNTCKVTFGTKL